jgi:hypothetical protein
MGILAKLRRLFTGEPEDPKELAAWLAEKARIREQKTQAKFEARAHEHTWKPPDE